MTIGAVSRPGFEASCIVYAKLSWRLNFLPEFWQLARRRENIMSDPFAFFDLTCEGYQCLLMRRAR